MKKAFSKTVAGILFAIPAIVFALTFNSCASTKNSVELPDGFNSRTNEFTEIWGYVMNTRINEFSPELPLTDAGYFIDAVNTYSKLNEVPARNKNFLNYKGRVHVVTSCDSRSQTHLLLSPDLPLRDKIISQLIEASSTYEGLQIDWELVPKDDKENFAEFLRIIKSKLGNKILSVAVPARIKDISNDPYDYSVISSIADRVIVMAYDEHWSTSKPGAIASNDWCKKIRDYSLTKIPQEKLVMGLSFYGRIWSDDTEGKKASTFPNTIKMIEEKKIRHINRDEGNIPYFTFKKTSTLTVWYDDVISLYERCKMYSEGNIQNVSFWRVGQEDPQFWKTISVK